MDETFLKLTNAAYKIIDFFPESDPLKSRAKEKVLSIMDNLTIINLMDGWASFQIDRAKNLVVQDIGILLHYFTLARNQGYLNSTNFFILSKEYNAILKEVKLTFGILPFLPQEPLALEKEPRHPPVPHKEVKEKKKTGPHSALTERQKKIITFLKENEKAQVMDLQNMLKGVTKRTIRRDLQELLKKGEIERVGKFNQVFYKIGH